MNLSSRIARLETDSRRLATEREAQREAIRQQRLAMLSSDESAVYLVAAAKAIIDRHGHDTEADAEPSRASDPAREAQAEQLMRTIEQANNRFRELQSDGRISAIVERLEELALLPVWLPRFA